MRLALTCQVSNVARLGAHHPLHEHRGQALRAVPASRLGGRGHCAPGSQLPTGNRRRVRSPGTWNRVSLRPTTARDQAVVNEAHEGSDLLASGLLPQVVLRGISGVVGRGGGQQRHARVAEQELDFICQGRPVAAAAALIGVLRAPIDSQLCCRGAQQRTIRG